ncbi:High cysteine membrane protein Group 3 [Giardia duodenalis]|uniref:High cysteine membrane protein Group 3 n=1 Tax=Giardia intestinalis (strain ATCC 50803 / WB clone C6) TaxID=184922 RepID=A8BTV5_GIAIC|nr:High cysteine membrane protein Group 3 [Giardia intestinalis]KAE8301266.1 High cysteine membrane protein Group 3 [Giardia intestinalis]|eukprot:XP_001704853.1 High cysteine membrane protein Group 3 [Giardia lamblia ATCC 50803]
MRALILLLLHGIFSECTQDSDCGGATGVCNVTIGGKKYCSKCDGARVPVNGDCRLLSLSRSICIVPTGSNPTPGSCSGCIRDFLFYRGGCYRTASLINAICKEKHIVEEGMYCGACAIEGDVPIDGVCVPAGSAAGNTCSKGVCTTCGNGYFLHYGSCYKFDSSPGSIVCPNQSDTTGSVCGSCGSKFLRNPSASSSATSCLACYGLDGTLFCERCRMNVLTSADSKPTLCTQCKIGYVPVDGRCLSNYSALAALAGCSDPRGNGLCDACSSGFMLFYGSCYSVDGPLAQAICAAEDQIYVNGRVLCKRCAQPDHYPLNGVCIGQSSDGTDGHTCSGGSCTACSTKQTADGTPEFFLFYGGCYDITHPIGKSICSAVVGGVCTTCASSDSSSVITITADGQSSKCLACWDDTVGGVANCGGCSLASDDPAKVVCTRCSDSTEPGEDGACPRALPPATPEGCAVQGCQACLKDSATTCDACFEPLIMKEDKTKCFGSCLALGPGYYNASGACARCAENCLSCVDGTSCSRCADGYYLEVSGSDSSTGACRPCAAGCSTCNDGSSTGCTTCLFGYYIATERRGQPGQCVKCDSDGNGYVGVQHCIVCRSTVGDGGAKNVVCQKCKDGYLKETDQGKTVCEAPPPTCTVELCALCVADDPNRCEHCTAGAYLCPRTAACTKDCASCGGSTYPDEDLGECQPCDIANCRVCATGLKCESCAENAVPISPDVYHTACMGCSDTGGMDGWVGLAGCTTCELTDKGGGSVNCLDPGYYRRGGLGGGAIAAIVIVVLLVLAVAGFLVWWFVFRRGGRPKRGAKYTSLMRGESYDYRQSLI